MISKQPQFSIIIPVLDEAAMVNQAISRLLRRFTKERFEIVVVDGDTQGGTIRRIEAAGIIKLASPKGRARQMNAGAARATSDILIFLHVDSELPDGALEKIGLALQSHRAGAFDVRFVGSHFIFRILSHTASWRSRMTRIPYGDQTLFFRKDYFNALGGFADIPIMEDVELMQRIKKSGERLAFIRDRAKTSARRWQAEGVLFTMIRNPILSFLFRRGVPPEKLAAFYKSGKLVYRESEHN